MIYQNNDNTFINKYKPYFIKYRVMKIYYQGNSGSYMHIASLEIEKQLKNSLSNKVIELTIS